MFSFIRRHWVAYLIGAVIAIVIGLGAAYYVGVIGSTPAAERADRVEREQANSEAKNNIENLDMGSGQGSE